MAVPPRTASCGTGGRKATATLLEGSKQDGARQCHERGDAGRARGRRGAGVVGRRGGGGGERRRGCGRGGGGRLGADRETVGAVVGATVGAVDGWARAPAPAEASPGRRRGGRRRQGRGRGGWRERGGRRRGDGGGVAGPEEAATAATGWRGGSGRGVAGETAAGGGRRGGVVGAGGGVVGAGGGVVGAGGAGGGVVGDGGVGGGVLDGGALGAGGDCVGGCCAAAEATRSARTSGRSAISPVSGKVDLSSTRAVGGSECASHSYI